MHGILIQKNILRFLGGQRRGFSKVILGFWNFALCLVRGYMQTSTICVIREIISQAHVPKCLSLRHISSISTRTFVVKMALKTADDFSMLLRKYHLKDLSSMNRLCVLHPIILYFTFYILLSLSGNDLLIGKKECRDLTGKTMFCQTDPKL